MKAKAGNGWTLAIVSAALFMVVLDNLVVSVALPTIHRDLGASIQSLEWTVNAYVLSYAALLLTGAALGDRFGRKRMFTIGLTIFTVASAGAALAPSTGALVAARAIQGMGAAIVTPLTLTLLAETFPAERRGMAIGVWSAVSGVAVAVGPLVGGAVVESLSWHWIFWINVPIGMAVLPLAGRVLKESRGPYGSLDLAGLALGSTGAFALIFGMFGSIFFLSQFMQNVLGNTPLQAGLKLLVWTGATMVVSPLAGVFSERLGSRAFMAAGLALQAGALAWLASTASTHMHYTQMIVPFVMAGAGMALVFAPSANAVLASVSPQQAGQASGANNAIRELGGVLGVAVLATVFTGAGGYGSPQAFVAGLTPALWVGVAVLAVGGMVAAAVPFGERAEKRDETLTARGGAASAAGAA
jgi:MFS family permease